MSEGRPPAGQRPQHGPGGAPRASQGRPGPAPGFPLGASPETHSLIENVQLRALLAAVETGREAMAYVEQLRAQELKCARCVATYNVAVVEQVNVPSREAGEAPGGPEWQARMQAATAEGRLPVLAPGITILDGTMVCAGHVGAIKQSALHLGTAGMSMSGLVRG